MTPVAAVQLVIWYGGGLLLGALVVAGLFVVLAWVQAAAKIYGRLAVGTSGDPAGYTKMPRRPGPIRRLPSSYG